VERLFDNFQCVIEIASYFGDRPGKFNDYLVDIKNKRFVEKYFQIIGEAVNRILKRDNNFAISNAQKIIGVQN